jgi:hypothetical protein
VVAPSDENPYAYLHKGGGLARLVIPETTSGKERGMRKVMSLGALMTLALLLASGVALAATINGTDRADGQAQSDDLYGGPGQDNLITGPGSEDAVFAEDGQQDLICIDPRSGATIESDDPDDVVISSNSC